MQNSRYDCIIVGAGPAGSSAAYHLAKRGHSVLILERETLPRYKPCGGGVSPEIAQWFDFDFTPAISLKVQRLRLTWNMADPVEADLDTIEPIWMVRREVFDHFLVQQAQKQGAVLKEQTVAKGITFECDRWLVHTTQGDFAGTYLVAADGARGSVAQWLGFKQRQVQMAGALEIEYPAPADHDPLTMHLELGMVKNGYAWNFPKADGYSIGAGAFRSKSKGQDYRPILEQYAASFNVDPAAAKRCGHPICVWNGDQPLHTQQALLVGEAACVVDPFTAEGIRPSMYSGVKAAEAIDSVITGQTDSLATYSQVMQQTWGTEMRWAQRLAGAFYRLPAVSYRVGVKRPSAPHTMGRIFCGTLHYSDAVDRALKRLSGGLIR